MPPSSRVLLVEDEILIARDLEQQLTELEYCVVGHSTTGEEAVQLAQQHQPDLILMDIQLAGDWDGIETTEIITESLAIPVVYLTAHADDATIQRAKITQPFGYILKPFEERELHTIIEMALYKHRIDFKLQRSEARFKAFMDNSPAVAFIKNAHHQYIYANRPWEEQFDEPRRDWAGRSDFDFFTEETAALFQKSDRQVFQTSRSIQTQEAVQGSTDGKLEHWLTIKFPLVDAQGETLVGGIGLNITEKIQLEEQVRHMQKLDAIGKLAGGVSHEFNNMLTAVNGNASLLLASMEKNHPWRDPLTEILKAGERAAELTQQLLAFSRKQMLAPQPLDLNVVIQNMQAMLQRVLGEDITFLCDLAPNLGPVQMDGSQLEQIILNLVVNARDAMPHGGQLTLTTDEVIFDEATVKRMPEMYTGVYRVLIVKDSGEGMNPSVLEHIFEPFFTTKELGRGSGMGLATVYGIVKQSHGHIEVTSQEGVGSTFTVYLPASQESLPTSSAETNTHPLPKGTETILLVEDEEQVLALAKRILEMCGYQVLIARHGKEAVRTSEQYSGTIHMLVSDVVMPQMNGTELAEALCKERPEMKVLYLSGFLGSAMVEQIRSNPDIPFLQKPFLPTVLAETVRRLLDK